MATKLWVGNANAVADVWTLTPANVEIGDVFNAFINNKKISVTATAATVANVTALLTAAINSSDIPEWQEVSAEDDTTHVTITNLRRGHPIVITTSTSSTTYTVDIATVRDGAAVTNETQTIRLAGVPTGGTFTLSFEGQTTAGLAWNISAANMETALEGLSSVDAVAVTRSGSGTVADPYIWTVEFQGAHAGVNVPAITGDGSSLTGITGAQYLEHATTTQGSSTGTNEVQEILCTSGNDGTFILTMNGGNYSVPVTGGTPHLGTVQSALDAAWGAGNAVATSVTNGFRIEWVGIYAGTNMATVGATGVSPVTMTVSTITQGSSTAVNEVQTLTVRLAPTGGTYTLTFDGDTTGNLAYNESAATMQTELEGLTTIGASNVTVTRSGSGTINSPYVYTITFVGSLAGMDVAQITSTSSITGCGVVIVQTDPTTTGINEQKSITISGSPTGGTFTLTLNGETTAGIAYNASAATVQAAIEALATPVPGDVLITGDAGGPWIYEFKGAYAATDIADDALTGSGASLTGSAQTLTATNTVAATGPYHWDNADNWQTATGGSTTVPANSDDIYFQNTDIPCLYGLAQSAVTLTSLHIDLSFTGSIGLPGYTGAYDEYRDQYLAISVTTLYIGEGEGPGPNLVKINVGSNACAIIQTGSGTSLDATLPAVIWKGSHVDNTLTITRGSFGAGVFAGETYVLKTILVGYREDRDGDVELFLGTGGSTITTLTVRGGDVTLGAAVTTLTQSGGEITRIGTGAIATHKVTGGRFIDRGTGTITASEVSVSGIFDRSQDVRAVTCTTMQLYAGATLLDPHGVITFTNPLQLVECGLEDVTLDLGKNRGLAVSTL